MKIVRKTRNPQPKTVRFKELENNQWFVCIGPEKHTIYIRQKINSDVYKYNSVFINVNDFAIGTCNMVNGTIYPIRVSIENSVMVWDFIYE